MQVYIEEGVAMKNRRFIYNIKSVKNKKIFSINTNRINLKGNIKI